MLTPEQQAVVDAAQESLEGVTPGPWNRTKRIGDRYYVGTEKKPIAEICNLYGEESEAIMRFVQHSRESVPALLSLVRTLAKKRAVICSRCGGTAQVVDEHGRPCGQTVHTFPCPDCTTGATWEDTP